MQYIISEIRRQYKNENVSVILLTCGVTFFLICFLQSGNLGMQIVGVLMFLNAMAVILLLHKIQNKSITETRETLIHNIETGKYVHKVGTVEVVERVSSASAYGGSTGTLVIIDGHKKVLSGAVPYQIGIKLEYVLVNDQNNIEHLIILGNIWRNATRQSEQGEVMPNRAVIRSFYRGRIFPYIVGLIMGLSSCVLGINFFFEGMLDEAMSCILFFGTGNVLMYLFRVQKVWQKDDIVTVLTSLWTKREEKSLPYCKVRILRESDENDIAFCVGDCTLELNRWNSTKKNRRLAKLFIDEVRERNQTS